MARVSRVGRYFFGVLKWKAAEAKGLVIDCNICGKRLMLDPTDDPSAGWAHTGCIEEKANG